VTGGLLLYAYAEDMLTFLPIIGPLSPTTSASITVSHCMVKVCQSISQSPVTESTDDAVNTDEN